MRNGKRGLSLNELADAFIKEHVTTKRKEKTQEFYKWLLDKHVRPPLGSKRAETISRADVAKLHLSLGGTRGNRMVAVVSSMYTWAGKHGLVADGCNPARGVEKFKERRREHFLTLEELERLGAAIREAETTGVPWQIDGRLRHQSI